MKILFSAGYYLFIVLIGALGLLLVGTLVPIPGNYEVKVVQSGSMEPAIKTGSVVFIKSREMYAVGDVITFGKDTKTQIPTTHRIVAIREDDGEQFFTVKGDANENADPNLVRKSEVIGKVLFSIPQLGYVLDFARQPFGFALLIGVPAGVVIIDEIGNIVAEVRRMRSKKHIDQPPSV